jgi:hypothetical protein
MIDYNREFVSALKTVLPTYHELTLTKGTKTPCLSYQELNNYVTDDGDTLEYSHITFQVKVWGTDLALLMRYAGNIDKVLRPLGFKRTASGELYDRNSSMIQKILTYEANALEIFD